jgi:hypothetical protein
MKRRWVEMVGSRRAMEIRRIRSWLALSATIVSIPWIVYLGLTLPANYVPQHWRVTWVGFDLLLLMFIIATAVLGFLHHRLLTLVTFTTGVLLVCDAWFDIMTARRGDIVISVLSATILIGGTLRIVRLGGPHFSRPSSYRPQFGFMRWPALRRTA